MPKRKVEINPECGERLRLLLLGNGVKQRELAERLEVDEKHISAIVRGRRRLTPEMAQTIAAMFPPIRAEWLLCRDGYKTQDEKDIAAKAAFDENRRVEELYNKAFRLFIDGIEDSSGLGLQSQGSDILLGDYIAVSDKTGRLIGCIPVESFNKLREELEHYASYLVNLLVKNEMRPLPHSKGVNENG